MNDFLEKKLSKAEIERAEISAKEQSVSDCLTQTIKESKRRIDKMQKEIDTMREEFHSEREESIKELSQT